MLENYLIKKEKIKLLRKVIINTNMNYKIEKVDGVGSIKWKFVKYAKEKETE
jgi:hypothetical protein